MTKEEFYLLISDMILPLFTGAEIIGEEESSSRESEVAQGDYGTILIKPTKLDEYRFVLKRSQPFKTRDVNFVKSILLELMKIYELDIEDPNYVHNLQTMAIEKAICEVVSENASQTMLGMIHNINIWANRTYEGKRMCAGIILNESETMSNPTENLHFSKILQKDFFALISDGKESCVEFDSNGFLLGHKFIDKVRSVPTLCPCEYINLAKYCGETKVGISLLESGDLLIFKNRELMFARRRGVWVSYSHDEVITLLSNRSSHTMKEIRKAIYFTALDVSFAKTGGCLVYLNREKSDDSLKHIDINDIVSEKHYLKKLESLEDENKKVKIKDIYPESYKEFLMRESATKSNAINKMIANRKFHELNRKIRTEMVSMDGATIIDFDGTVIATGAIVKIEAGSSGGGRLAATRTLSKYGMSIKISMDGNMQCYTTDKKTKKTKELFRVG